MIACVRVPYFVASVEARRTPGLSGKPVAFYEPEESSNGIFALSEQAGLQGVRRGMTITQAQALCPDVRVLLASSGQYRRTADEVVEALADFSEFVEVQDGFELKADARQRKKTLSMIHTSQMDEQLAATFYVDLGKQSVSESHEFAGRIGELIKQLNFTPAIGIAAGKFTARIASASSTPGIPLIIPQGKEADFLKDFPITLLPIDGEMIRQLYLLGLVKLGDLAGLPVSTLQDRFGKPGRTIHRLAHGRDTSHVARYQPKIVERLAHNFDEPIDNRGTIDAVLSQLVDELAARLQSQSRTASTVELVMGTESRTSIERQLVLREPVSSPEYLSKVIRELGASISPSGRINRLEVSLSGIAPMVGRQLNLFEREPVSQAQLYQVLKDFIARHGEDSAYWLAVPNPDARLPERRSSIRKVSKDDLLVA